VVQAGGGRRRGWGRRVNRRVRTTERVNTEKLPQTMLKVAAEHSKVLRDPAPK
jgi:hypothetical protein